MMLNAFLLGNYETAVIGENFYVKQPVTADPSGNNKKIFLVYKGVTSIPKLSTEERMKNGGYFRNQSLWLAGYWIPDTRTFINVDTFTFDTQEETGWIKIVTCQHLRRCFDADVMESVKLWADKNTDSILPEMSENARGEAQNMFNNGYSCMDLDKEIERYIKCSIERISEFDYIGYAATDDYTEKNVESICKNIKNFIAFKKGADAFLQQMIKRSNSLDPFNVERRTRDVKALLCRLCEDGIKTCRAVFDFSGGNSGRTRTAVEKQICTDTYRCSSNWIEGTKTATDRFTEKEWLPIAIPYGGHADSYYPYITAVYSKKKKIYEAAPMPVQEEEFLYRRLMDGPEADYEELCREYGNMDCSFKISGLSYGILFYYVMQCRNSTAGGTKYLVEHGALEDDIQKIIDSVTKNKSWYRDKSRNINEIVEYLKQASR